MQHSQPWKRALCPGVAQLCCTCQSSSQSSGIPSQMVGAAPLAYNICSLANMHGG